MVTVEIDGTLVFEMAVPGAERVELVGDFEGFHEERIEMERVDGDRYRIEVLVRPGAYLFRYLADGDRWILDEEAHGLHRGADGLLRSRAWRPPLRLVA